MRVLLASVLSLTVFALPNLAAAQTSEPQPTFTGPPRGKITQFFLGLFELGAADSMMPAKIKAKSILQSAERQLQHAMDLMTSEEQRASLLKSIKSMSQTEFLEEATINEERFERILTAPLVSAAERETQIALATEYLTQARAAMLTRSVVSGTGRSLVRGLRYIGATLLFIDVAGRLYVWNALDADPTLSPTATYLYKQAQKIHLR